MKEATVDITTEFNPMQDIPANDEQAMIALRHERPAVIANSLCGIYRCRRELGSSVLDAYETALKAHIDAYRRTQQTCDEPTDKTTRQAWWAGHEYVDAS